jgi:hypothetical protein
MNFAYLSDIYHYVLMFYTNFFITVATYGHRPSQLGRI